jgi:hypothetical protein
MFEIPLGSDSGQCPQQDVLQHPASSGPSHLRNPKIN